MFYYISFESFRLILGFICFFHHSIWLLCMGITRNAQSNDRETAKIYTTARANPYYNIICIGSVVSDAK